MRREERRKYLSELKTAPSTHEQQFPTDANEIAVNRNGERQLLGHTVDHTVLGLLLTSDIYRLNRRLRSGDTMEGPAGMWMDQANYESHQQFFDDAMRIFGEVGSDLDLDEPIEVFRGVGIPSADAPGSFDLWGIRAHLESGTYWRPTVVEDPGFTFTSPSETLAQRYDGSADSHIAPEWKIVCTIKIRRGLCIPARAYRTPQLMRHLDHNKTLSTAIGQVIIPPVSRWHITEATPDHETNTISVRMHQLV